MIKNILLKPPGGRMFRRWLAATAMLLVFSLQSALAQKVLNPHSLSGSDNYMTGNISTGGVTVPYQYAGNNDRGNDIWIWIEVNNATLSWEKPYIQFHFVYWDDDDSDDTTFDNALFVKYKNDATWYMIAQSETESYDWVNKDTGQQGYVVCQAPQVHGSNGMQATYMRWYPRYIDLYTDGGRQVEKLRLVQGWNQGNDGLGDYVASYGKKVLDNMVVYDIPVKYNYGSDIQKIGTFTEKANGQVSYSVSGLPTPSNSIASSNSESVWASNARNALSDITVNWNGGSGASVRAYNSSGSTISSESKMSFTKSGTTSSATASLSVSNYNVKRRYLVGNRIDRTFRTGTNGFYANHVYDIVQTVVYNGYTGWLNPMAKPSNLKLTPKMWEKQIVLNWDAPTDANTNKDGKWYVFRNGTRIATLDYNTRTYTDTDGSLAYDQTYNYEVSFGLNAWGTLSQPEPSLKASASTKITRSFSIALNIEPLDNGFKLNWNHAAIQSSATSTFKVMRRKAGVGAAFTEIGSGVTANRDATSHTYTDTQLESVLGTIYEYKVTIDLMGKTYESPSQTIVFNQGSKVLGVTTSKGELPGSVRVQWTAKQVGTGNTQYVVYRRLLGSTKNFAAIYTTQGTATSYTYEDNTALPGQYYEYKVESQVPDSNNEYQPYTSLTGDGFSQATGVLSGRITYGTGTAVEGVRVNVIKSDDDENQKSQFYSMRMNSVGAGVNYIFTDEQYEEIFTGPFTAQMWINMDDGMKNESNDNYSVPHFLRSSDFHVYAQYDATNKNYKILFGNYKNGVWDNVATDLTIRPSEYNHVTLGIDPTTGVTIRIIGRDGTIRRWSKEDIGYVPNLNEERRLGFGHSWVADQTFTGYVDELRLWDKLLTDEELLKNYDRLLSGTEPGLCLYSPLDEGIANQPTAYDYSKTEGVPNSVHGKILPGTECDEYVPAAEQLSLYGITDSEGNYVIRGVPFTGDGTNYMLTPAMGIHEFSPRYVTRYVSGNSLNHSGIDIEDVSSFPVSGTVFYENTLYPVEGAYLYVDGNIASRDGQPIMTDAQGAFSISVPIGDHFVEVRKEGHTFVGGGRYPEDPSDVGTRHTFDREISGLSFYDNTRVTVAGRVVGGEIESRKPLGMGLSTANIGQAKITLSTGYKMNVVTTVSGTTSSTDSNPEDVVVNSMNSDVQSVTTFRGGDYAELIEITTDPQTGEFVALLPPVGYKIDNVSVMSNAEITFGDFVNIDATNPLLTYTDSTTLSDGLQKAFEYNTSFVASYRVAPTFTVTDASNENGAFGEKTYTVTDEQGEETTLDLYTVGTDGSVTYTYGHPIFVQLSRYSLRLKAYEEYVNKDDAENPVTTQVPLSGTVVSITNQLSSSQEVWVEGADAGQFHGDLKSNELALDSIGEAVYTFSAGFPNILGDYTRGMNFSFNNNGQMVNWSRNETFKGIILGTLPSGNNFVTAGPDKILMVLRDPPGSNSNATWEEGQTISQSTTTGGTVNSTTTTENVIHAGVDVTTIAGTPGFGVINDIENMADVTAGVSVVHNQTKANEKVTTVTASRAISTSDSPDYVGYVGDVFVGTSTNLVFGNARSVGLYRNTEGSGYGISQKDVMSVGSKFGTMFNYTQYYVENTLLGNLESLRNSLLITVSEAEYPGYTNSTDKPVYVTTLSPDDERFGSMNGDKDIWGSLATSNTEFREAGGPSYRMVLPQNMEKDSVYTDEVLWYNQQIAMWIQTLADNEKAKVDAIENRAEWFDKNISFDAGTSIENTQETETSDISSVETVTEGLAIVGAGTGMTFNAVGISLNVVTESGGGTIDGSSSETTNTVATSYALAEDGTDALTVDVYKAPDGFGPIFVTRAGQTSAPYEDKVETQYYKPGTVISYATMQVEIPEITVTNAVATDVPAGGEALFELQLDNLSEVGEDLYFDLAVADGSNPDGAALSMDGAPLTEGRAILVPAGRTIKKTLVLKQTDQSVLDYEDIQLVLKSQSQGDPTAIFPAIADTVAVSAYFVPACSDITIDIRDKTMNMFTGDQLAIRVGDFNRSYRSFKGLRIQYKYANDEDWTTAKEYVINEEDKTNNNEMMPEGSPITYNLDMSNTGLFPDGEYTFRAVTMCDFGVGEVNNESAEIIVIKDMARPLALGSANPADGILETGDDIFVTFNEDIRSGALTAGENFLVTGILNGARVDHAAALQLNGAAEAAAKTEADISLHRQSFAADLWMNIQGAGTIWEHGAGENEFVVAVNSSNKLVVTIDGNAYTSANSVPTGKWAYLSLSYAYSEGASTLSAQVAEDAGTTNLFNAMSVVDYTGNGALAVGKNLTGAVHELALWNRARTPAESQGEMYTAKSAGTPNLIGYWKMDEGKGARLTDKARNRHMTSAGNWAFNNVNYAAAFNGTDSRMALDITAVSVRPQDDYAIELWFNGASQTNATIFSLGSDDLALRADGAGRLALTVKGIETQLAADRLDGQWHHFALNVLRNGTAIAYIDGENVRQLASADVPSLAGDALILGEGFKGSIDEVRLWNATLTGKLLAERNNRRMDTASVSGLVAYYPFETKSLDSYGQVVTTFTTADQSASKAANTTAQNVTQAATAPGLKEAVTETNLQFSFTASERQVFITLLDDPARLEGTTVNLTLRNVRDMNNNIMLPVVWSAYVSRNSLKWSESEVKLERTMGEDDTEFSVSVTNSGGETQQWMLANVPTWLSVSDEQGSLRAQSNKTLTFTVEPSTPIGNYEETIYLYGNDGIYEPLTVSLKVKGEAPDWSVNPADFDQSMNIIGQLKVDGKVSDDGDDLVAAFIGNRCVGLASPIYFERYDAHFVLMSLYRNSDMSEKNVTFKMWDASTGDIYPSVVVSQEVTFESNAVIGTMQEPIALNAKELREQRLTLAEGWTWMSLNVKPEDGALGVLFPGMGDRIENIKGNDGFAMPSGGGWDGSLDGLTIGRMYMVKSSIEMETSFYGAAINPAEEPLTITPNWNWIGNNTSAVASPNDAFAELAPEPGDIVKSQSGFAVYEGYQWIGTLTALEPGGGYMYRSAAAAEKSFCYPNAVSTLRRVRARNNASDFTPQYFEQIAPGLYPNNMTVVAVVKRGGEIVKDVEVGVFAGTECREAIRSDENGMLFLTIHGEGAGTKLTFKVLVDNEVFEAAQSLTYEDNGIVGSPDACYVIDLDNATNLLEIDVPLDNVKVYSLSGVYLGKTTRGLPAGLYIIDGKKAVVK